MRDKAKAIFTLLFCLAVCSSLNIANANDGVPFALEESIEARAAVANVLSNNIVVGKFINIPDFDLNEDALIRDKAVALTFKVGKAIKGNLSGKTIVINNIRNLTLLYPETEVTRWEKRNEQREKFLSEYKLFEQADKEKQMLLKNGEISGQKYKQWLETEMDRGLLGKFDLLVRYVDRIDQNYGVTTSNYYETNEADEYLIALEPKGKQADENGYTTKKRWIFMGTDKKLFIDVLNQSSDEE